MQLSRFRAMADLEEGRFANIVYIQRCARIYGMMVKAWETLSNSL